MIQYKIKEPPDKQARKRSKNFLHFQPREIFKISNLKSNNRLPILKTNHIKNIKRIAGIKNNMYMEIHSLMLCVMCIY